jgi:hypothetical protein
MFDSLPLGDESAANQESSARCAWLYGAYCLLGRGHKRPARTDDGTGVALTRRYLAQ